jgi:hypothetical protein
MQHTISLTQMSRVPPNLEFVVDDAEDVWTGQKLDYIHIRMLSGAISDWHRLLRQAYDHLNPGGWLEVTEFEIDVHTDSDPAMAQKIRFWCDGLAEAANKIGRRFDVAVNLKEWMEQVGYTEIVQDIKKVGGNFFLFPFSFFLFSFFLFFFFSATDG